MQKYELGPILFVSVDEKTAQFQSGCRGVVAVDLLEIEPIAGVHVMSGFDIMQQNTSDQIALLTQNKK